MSAVPPVPARPKFASMHESDVAAVLAAEHRIYPFPWTEGNFTDSLKAGYSAWVCREGGALAGYAVMMRVLDEVHLLNISILPERQRRGLGSDLLSHLFHVARGHGAMRMLLEVRSSNESGQVFYRRFLFGEIGRRREYYPAHAGREDAIVMAREL
ncbi:MAG: ribosomal protein S18-alanine N-acetyltransferase [Rhodocyclaceae bacterium]|nr:ribosomal protein S18-alanine N-acetyltransferase [Rhodocyclaceae bacterium]